VKGTLTYELFTSMPERLKDEMKSLFGLTIIDKPNSIEQVYAQMAIEEFLPEEIEGITNKAREIAMKQSRQYLNQSSQKNTEHFQKMEDEVAAWKIDEIDETPKIVQQETVMQSSKKAFDIWKRLSDFGGDMYRNVQVLIQKWTKESKPAPEKKEYIQQLPEKPQKLIKERKPTPEEKHYMQPLTDEEPQGFTGDFPEAKTIVKTREAKELERKHAELEKAKEDMRRYFTNPRFYDQQGVPNTEAIQKTVATLKDIYQPGTLDYEAFNEVIKEMGFK
jgi:hypothetical protein